MQHNNFLVLLLFKHVVSNYYLLYISSIRYTPLVFYYFIYVRLGLRVFGITFSQLPTFTIIVLLKFQFWLVLKVSSSN